MFKHGLISLLLFAAFLLSPFALAQETSWKSEVLAVTGHFGWVGKGAEDQLSVGERLDLYREGRVIGKVEVVEVGVRSAKIRLIEGESIAVLDEVRRPRPAPPKPHKTPEPEEPPVHETPPVEEPVSPQPAGEEAVEEAQGPLLSPGEDPPGLLEGYGYVYTPRAMLGAPGWAGSLTFVGPPQVAGFDCRAAAAVGFSHQARRMVAGARWQGEQECRGTGQLDKQERLRAHVKFLFPGAESGRGSTIGALLALEQEKQESETAAGITRATVKIITAGLLWGWQAQEWEVNAFGLWEQGSGVAGKDSSGDLLLGGSFTLSLHKYFDLIAEYRGSSDLRAQAWATGFRWRLARELSLFGFRAEEGSGAAKLDQIVAGFSLPL